MNTVILKENMSITEESKEYILKYSNNSIRTLLNYLEKIHILTGILPNTSITLNICVLLCTDIKIFTFEKYICCLKNGNLKEAIQTIYDVHDYGFSVIDILELFFIFVKTTELLQENEKYEIIKYLCKYITIFYSVHEDIIELALFTNNLYVLLFYSHLIITPLNKNAFVGIP
jgi:DNA polymerase III gamma/tau subunit